MAKLLVIDDDRSMLQTLTMILRKSKHTVTAVADGREAERLVQAESYDLIVSDIHMTPVDGLQLLTAIRAAQPGTPVILITAFASLEIALEAVKNGAFDFITKPFRVDDFLAIVQQALDYPRIASGNIQLEPPPADQRPWDRLVSKSKGMQALRRRLEQLALTDEMVVIQGEPGTGKRLLAQVLHDVSRRSRRPFMAVNCAALPAAALAQRILGQGAPVEKAGVLEAAEGGSVLLEHIEELPADARPQLMRLIREHQYCRLGENAPRPADVRLLATCLCRPETRPGGARTSSEWIQTLAAIALHAPPLRERSADLLPLINRLVYARADAAPGASWKIAAKAYDILEEYAWPNNVKELEEVLRRAMASARNRLMVVEDLPAPMAAAVAQANNMSKNELQRNEIRGKSFREYVRIKQKELASTLKAKDE